VAQSVRGVGRTRLATRGVRLAAAPRTTPLQAAGRVSQAAFSIAVRPS
jgi:hypothetical protein